MFSRSNLCRYYIIIYLILLVKVQIQVLHFSRLYRFVHQFHAADRHVAHALKTCTRQSCYGDIQLSTSSVNHSILASAKFPVWAFYNRMSHSFRHRHGWNISNISLVNCTDACRAAFINASNKTGGLDVGGTSVSVIATTMKRTVLWSTRLWNTSIGIYSGTCL